MAQHVAIDQNVEAARLCGGLKIIFLRAAGMVDLRQKQKTDRLRRILDAALRKFR